MAWQRQMRSITARSRSNRHAVIPTSVSRSIGKVGCNCWGGVCNARPFCFLRPSDQRSHRCWHGRARGTVPIVILGAGTTAHLFMKRSASSKVAASVTVVLISFSPPPSSDGDITLPSGTTTPRRGQAEVFLPPLAITGFLSWRRFNCGCVHEMSCSLLLRCLKNTRRSRLPE